SAWEYAKEARSISTCTGMTSWAKPADVRPAKSTAVIAESKNRMTDEYWRGGEKGNYRGCRRIRIPASNTHHRLVGLLECAFEAGGMVGGELLAFRIETALLDLEVRVENGHDIIEIGLPMLVPPAAARGRAGTGNDESVLLRYDVDGLYMRNV